MDKNNLQPGDETFQSSDGDVEPTERYHSGSGSDQEPDSAIQRMTTDEPVDPDRPDDPGITTD
jgi:hypothetical protein